MANKSITSANSALTITCTSRNIATGLSTSLGAYSSILGIPTRIEGWASDSAFSTDQVESSIMVQGVDGKAHTGWVPYLVPFNVNLYPDSDSQAFLTQIYALERTMRESLLITAVLVVPSTQQKLYFDNGVISRLTSFASHGRVQQAQATGFIFETVTPMPY